MAVERDALMEAAYPEVQAICQKYGLIFEVIDLRWGIHNAMGTGHATAQLFLEEIRRCQKLSIGPSFIALIGNHYGNCPPPLTIKEREFEALLSQLLVDPHTLQLLAQWYLKDENSIPPVYVLQRSPQPRPDQEQSLVLALQRAAWEAEKCSLISQEQRQLYHKSEIHNEIETGLFSSGENELGAVVFFKELEESTGIHNPLDGLEEEEADGALNSEDQQMLAELKTKIANFYPDQLKVHKVSSNMTDSGLRHKPQPKYLKEFCEQFIVATNHQMLRSLRSQEGSLGSPHSLFQELAHHTALGQEQSQTFCWRQELLDHLCQRIKQNNYQAHSPLVIHGPPGCGKTTLLCHLCKAVHAVLGQETVVVLRLLEASQLSSACDNLLHNICLQVCLAMGLPPPCAKGGGSSVLFFHSLLLSVSLQGTQPLVLILDSVEQLCAPRDFSGVFWLPKVCPPKVHIIISVLLEEHSALHKVIMSPEDYFEMGPLSQEQAGEILAKHLASVRRTLSPPQRALFQQSFSEGGHALPVALAINEVQQWASYTPLSAVVVFSTASEAVHHLCGYLEQVHGSIFVGHALGYLACARCGLSEAELKDILSLDNEVLSEVYQFHPPPSKVILRLPPLLWARLYHDLTQWLVERWADGFLLMGFLHREFSDIVQERYLLTPEERIKRHLLLADFFRGTWSWGMKKPVELPSSSKPVSVDRKVTPQPLWFSSTLANQRKLSELPFHLLQAGRIEELKRDVLGNMNWIACKIVTTDVGSLTSDFAMCLVHISCPELCLLRDSLLLLEPILDITEGHVEVSVIYTEMLARLHFLAPFYPNLIGSLCQQCLSWFGAWPHPVLIPLCGFLYPPGGPLQKTITGFPKGTTVLEFSLDHRVLLAGSKDGLMVAWDMDNFTVRHILNGHSAEIRCMRVFRKGMHAASVALDHTLRLWNLVSGREELSIHNVHAGEQNWCQLHLDEKNRIIYWASGSEVNAWYLETGMPAFQIPVEPLDGWLCTAVFMPRLVVVTVSERGTLCLWDSISGHLYSKQELQGLGEEVPTCSVLLQKLGRMVAGFSQGSLLTISSDGHSLLEKLPAGLRFMVLSKDESLFVTGFGLCVRVFLADSSGFHQLLASDLMHNGEVNAAAISDDNTTVFTSSHDGCIWTSKSYNIVIWDSVEGEECDTLDVSAPVQCLEVAEQRNLLFVGLASGTVLVFPLDSRQDVGCIPPAENQKPINSLALTQNEFQLAIACDDMVQVLNVEQGESGPLFDQPIYTFYTQIPGAIISSIALLTGYRVLYGMTSGELFLYNCSHGQVFPLEAHSSNITCLKISHEEKWAVSGSGDSLQCLWDVDLCCWEHEMFFQKVQDSFSQGILCACFSKDDRYLFTGTQDQCITVWDVLKGTLLAVQFVHTNITKIMPTADGFVATTRLGYMVREKFRCPQPISPHYNPLCNIKATCRVKSRKNEGDNPEGQLGDQRNTLDRNICTNKLSQICKIV
ncbi:NACHT domain- and WD repeat-containing protein 1 [Tiliqua scincoides]|uniref:NACHT domain- and WD repeat-containing protein 1 n=1 Tax=Tiliqua scincoides TaxID=71010 RepID=UPI003462B8CB